MERQCLLEKARVYDTGYCLAIVVLGEDTVAWDNSSPRSDSYWSRIWPIAPRLSARLNRGLPASVQIRIKVRWPLLLIPLALINQIFAPHPVWIVLFIALLGFYIVSLMWVRTQAPLVTVARERIGTILVAGDILHEEFELRNESRLPVLWAEFVDDSELPGYNVGRVIACGASTFYRWRSEVMCERRGVFRLGPHQLNFGDPFGLFAVERDYQYIDMVLIYPRVVKLPPLELPHGNAGGTDWRRRPLRGSLPAASVSDYRPGDSLRYIHWPSTARRSRLTVKDLEVEPSGDVWVVLDLNRQVQSGEGSMGTLEHGIVLAASLAAELLAEGERRAVGLFTVSGDTQGMKLSKSDEVKKPIDENEVALPSDDLVQIIDRQVAAEEKTEDSSSTRQMHSVIVPPQSGRAQLWRIMSALAPVLSSDVPLADMLHSARDVLGRSRTLIVITPETSTSEIRVVNDIDNQITEFSPSHDNVTGRDVPLATVQESTDWLAQLLHLQSSGLDSSVLMVLPGDQDEAADASQQEAYGIVRGLLARYDIPAHVSRADSALQPILTFRRTKTVIRSTPSGGVVTYEVEEEVG